MAETDEYPNERVRISDGFHGRDTISNRKRVAYMLSVVRDNIVFGEEDNIYLSGGIAYLIRDRGHYYCDGLAQKFISLAAKVNRGELLPEDAIDKLMKFMGHYFRYD